MTNKGNIDTFLFDLDGTLYFKGTPIEGSTAVLKKLRSRGYKLSFVTNTDGRTVGSIHKMLLGMGFDIQEGEIFTPVAAAITFFENRPDKSCYCLGCDDVLESFKGLNIDEKNPDYVFIADFSDKISYAVLNKVFRYVMNGAELLAASKTMYYYGKDGININTGAFVRMFEEACGKEALLLGKPSGEFFRLALERLDSEARTTVIVGDDLAVDIVGAKNIGAVSALVKTGHFDADILKKSVYQPDYILDSTANITDLFF